MPIAQIGALCEQLVLDHRYDKNGRSVIEPKVDRPGEEEVEDEYANYALVFRRFFNDKHEMVSTRVDINSRPLLAVFSEIVKYYPSHPERFAGVLTINSPFMILYHHWDQLKDYCEKTEDDVTRMHLDFLLDFMDRELGDDAVKVERLLDTKHISFPTLWTIFQPGDLLLQRLEGGYQRLWRIVQVELDQDNRGRYLGITVSGCDYDGTEVGRHDSFIIIRESEVGRSCPLSSLSAIPLNYLDNPDDIIARMATRGRKFLDLQGIHVRRYDGRLQMLSRPALGFFSKDRSEYSGTFIPSSVSGRILIDTKTFMEENPFNPPQSLYDVVNEIPAEAPAHVVKSWDNMDPMLCPPYVHGFCPGIKQWCRFYIDQISEAEWHLGSFDDLILPASPKKVIQSLVSYHQYPDRNARDQQAQKGKGLVVLLHGVPGTGKTLMAESVSEMTKRALIVISSGELGTSVSDIDYNLTKFLQYATIWGAVVLIDEADVFLEARTRGLADRLEQNSLVAVFLRQLEYFHGIVFLTSNRATELDPAIKSRIHLFLEFSMPDRKAQETLWRLRLNKIAPQDCDFKLEEALKVVASTDMNGREVSNAVNTISTLARADKKKIQLQHFQTFVHVWDSFKQAVLEDRGEDGNGKLGTSWRWLQNTSFMVPLIVGGLAMGGWWKHMRR
ncbi:hypothetical protein CVT26_001404 [Gymnopilus dilepis]|uniref:AAA+ ATPase domain-containing protein n=1 Tax=Gymnopilus dilepis TaxID=231916 RepID=A0A409W7A4_9AGAR|nr:hypothetical protein CVT26_001404 [Gymnopilus dilepis]